MGAPEKLPAAAEVYRTALAAQPDASVVIVTVGDLTNVAELLQLPAEGEKASGLDLVKRKVRLWACMGGNFIGKPAKDDLKLGNNNFTVDKAGSLAAVRNWPTGVGGAGGTGQLMFVGREIGSVPSGLQIGKKFGALPADHPLRMAYELYFGGTAKDRHVADPTTVLFAVRGPRDYWDAETKGYMDLKADMTFEWKYDQDKGQGYLLKKKVDGKPNDRAIEAALEALCMQPPKGKGGK